MGATAEYPAAIVQDSTCAHIFKEQDMCRNNLTQVAGYSAVKPIDERFLCSYRLVIDWRIPIN